MSRVSAPRKIFMLFILVGCFILLLTIMLALTAGSVRLSLGKVLQILTNLLPWSNPEAPIDAIEQKILLDLRLPRIILAMIIGATLSIAGVIFQSLFRNPMADPSVIGTSSGAALGATLAIAAGFDFRIMNISSVPLAAFAGAVSVTLLVYNLARTGNRLPMAFMLLAGIAVSTFLSSIISLIMILRRTEMYNILSWLMGGFALRRWSDVVMVLPYIVIGILITVMFSRELNLMLLGEERARQLGLNSNRLQKIMVLSASLLVAGAVSISGVIGFVGLLVPHMARLVVGPDHKYLLPASALAGGTFLLISDTISRTVLAPLELPVGIVTSLCGAPFFIYLLRKNKRASETFK